MTHRRVPVIVLAGGASRRMGMDKRSVLVEGVPMLQRVVDRLAGYPVIIVVDPRRPGPPVMPARSVRIVPDLRPGEGPLAALEAGLTATREPTALVVGADMPWLDPAILGLLVEHAIARPAVSVACLEVDGRPQPLPMLCRRTHTLRRATRLLDLGERRLGALLDGPGACLIPEAAWRLADPTGRSLRDVDTPADMAWAP